MNTYRPIIAVGAALISTLAAGCPIPEEPPVSPKVIRQETERRIDESNQDEMDKATEKPKPGEPPENPDHPADTAAPGNSKPPPLPPPIPPPKDERAPVVHPEKTSPPDLPAPPPR